MHQPIQRIFGSLLVCIGRHVFHSSLQATWAQGRVTIVGAGLPSTGVSSLRVALEKIGYKVAGVEVFDESAAYREVWRNWLQAGQSPEPVYQELIGRGYNAFVGEPFSSAYSYIMMRDPSARVILTVHNASLLKWYKGFSKALQPWRRFGRHWWMDWSFNDHLEFRRSFHNGWGCSVLGPSPQVRISTEDQCINAHKRYIVEVKQTVPSNKLLVYDVKEGWTPLCVFLGIVVPAMKFPTAGLIQITEITWTMLGLVVAVPCLICFSRLAFKLYQNFQDRSRGNRKHL